MSSQTPNLNLVLPVGTEHVSRQIINDNNTKIDTAVGANSQGIASNSTAISKLDSDANTTNDVLADALTVTSTTYFKGSGSEYTGSLVDANLAWGTFIVNVNGDCRYVYGIGSNNRVSTNFYNGTSWDGWVMLAPKSEVDTLGNKLNVFQYIHKQSCESSNTTVIDFQSSIFPTWGVFMVTCNLTVAFVLKTNATIDIIGVITPSSYASQTVKTGTWGLQIFSGAWYRFARVYCINIGNT